MMAMFDDCKGGAAVQSCAWHSQLQNIMHLDLSLQAVCAILVVLDRILHNSRWDQTMESQINSRSLSGADLQWKTCLRGQGLNPRG